MARPSNRPTRKKEQTAAIDKVVFLKAQTEGGCYHGTHYNHISSYRVLSVLWGSALGLSFGLGLTAVAIPLTLDYLLEPTLCLTFQALNRDGLPLFH